MYTLKSAIRGFSAMLCTLFLILLVLKMAKLVNWTWAFVTFPLQIWASMAVLLFAVHYCLSAYEQRHPYE